MRRRPIVALILITVLGNSSMACACALATLDTPATMHHGMSGDHADTGTGYEHDCGSSCNSYAATASANKTFDASDHRTEKPLLPAAHHGDADQAFVPGLPAQWLYEKQHPRPPLSTPVSRSDTLLD